MMKVFEEIAQLISTKLNIGLSFFRLVGLEARLAGLSLVPLLCSLVGLIVIGLSAWLTLVAILFFAINMLLNNIMLSLTCLFLLNLLTLAILAKAMLYNVNNMSFKNTRKLLISRNENSTQHEKTKAHTSHQDRRKQASNP